MKEVRWHKAAFIYYNHMVAPGQLRSVPFAFNTLAFLAQECASVDAYLWEPEQGVRDLLPQNIHVYSRNLLHQSRWKSVLLRLYRFYRFGLNLRFIWKSQYDIVFAMGQIGSYVGEVVSSASKCPLVYFNDEFPDTIGHPARWVRLEKHAACTAALVVVPDESRVAPLLAQLQCPRQLSTAVLPNSPLTKEAIPVIDWRARLKLKAGVRPFLYAGSLHDWMQFPELLCSVWYWPENAVLIVQSAHDDPVYRRQLAHLVVKDRIVWNTGPLSEPELNSLTQFCDGSFALYRDVDDNNFYMGCASGKMMRSIALGTPVIASNFPSLRFVSENKLGFQVTHPGEIPACIGGLIEKRAEFGRNCVDYFEATCSFEQGWHRMLEALKTVTDDGALRP